MIATSRMNHDAYKFKLELFADPNQMSIQSVYVHMFIILVYLTFCKTRWFHLQANRIDSISNVKIVIKSASLIRRQQFHFNFARALKQPYFETVH